jgi:hypothetical protein
LPALDVLACFFARDYYNKLGDLAASHPFLKLRHDLLDVGLDLIV